MRRRRFMQDRDFGDGLVAIGGIGAGERTRADEFSAQQRNPRLFIQGPIIIHHACTLEQIGDHAFVHGAVLAHVERGQVEPERFHRADQPAQRAARCQHTAPGRVVMVMRQPACNRDQIVTKRLRAGIGRAGQSARARRGLARQRQMRRGKPRINARQGAAIRLIGTGDGAVAARLCQRRHGRINARQFVGDRQFGPQQMNAVEIMAQHRLARFGQRSAH